MAGFPHRRPILQSLIANRDLRSYQMNPWLAWMNRFWGDGQTRSSTAGKGKSNGGGAHSTCGVAVP